MSKSYVSPDVKTVAGRVRFLLRELWDDNQAKMAKSVHVAPATLSRVMTGKRPAGRELLLAIGTCKGINLQWLLTGAGEPFLDASLTIAPPHLPIAIDPLPGKPADYPNLLLPEAFPVPSSLSRSSRYFLRLAPRHVQGPLKNAVKEGDLILLETDVEFWRGRPSLDRKLAVVRRVDDPSSGVELGYLTVPANEDLLTVPANDDLARFGQHRRRLRAPQWEKTILSAPDVPLPSSEEARQTGSDAPLSASDAANGGRGVNIVAVALQLVRPLWP